jgi:Nucleotidyl transferase AbiEii toxin, Type IV TA system
MKPRDTTAGRVYLDLKALAKQHDRPAIELLSLYALEGLLARLAISPYLDRFILKGGALLAAYDARRPTQDVDLGARRLAGTAREMLGIVKSIAEIGLDDGLIYDTAAASVQDIRSAEAYPSVRVSMTAGLYTARISFHADISVGDPVWPEPQGIDLPRLLGGHIHIIGYPLVMVLAEKISACVQMENRNTRWRDFADIRALIRHHDVNGLDLCMALGKVTAHRHVPQIPLSEILDGFAGASQPRWEGWRRRMNLERSLPADFAGVLAEVIAFADPVLTGEAAGKRWSAMAREWGR